MIKGRIQDKVVKIDKFIGTICPDFKELKKNKNKTIKKE
jgi:hypothetical protein